MDGSAIEAAPLKRGRTRAAKVPPVTETAPAALLAHDAPPAAAPAEISTAAPPEDHEMATTFKEAAETAKTEAQTFTAEATDRTKGAMEKGMKFVEEMSSFAKGNVEAVVESSKIAAKGAEDIARYTADYARGTVEKANETAKRFAAVKSPAELFQLHTDLARSAMDGVAQETAKFAENYLKLMGEMAQPIQNRFALAAEKVKAVAA